MPHFRMEYSANLEAKVNMTALCDLVRQTILATGLFEIGAIRVRAFPADHWSIADNLQENSFIDMEFRIGKGRSAEDRKATGEAIFTAVSAFLKERFETPHFALSLEIREIDAELSWKKNAIHPRLRGA